MGLLPTVPAIASTVGFASCAPSEHFDGVRRFVIGFLPTVPAIASTVGFASFAPSELFLFVVGNPPLEQKM
jgi:hypothetical protein